MQTLRGQGLEGLTVALRFGQALDSEAIADDWVSAVAGGYQRCREAASGGPLYALGYSLGAIATLAFLRRTPSAKVDRLLLIAPPLALTSTAELVRILTPLRRLGMALPSLAPRDIRERSSTTLADYHAMLQLIKEISEAPLPENIAQVNTSVVLSTEDELVDATGVQQWITERHLGWRVRVVSRGPAPHHLLLSEPRMGAAAWGELTGEMLEQFAAPPTAHQ